MISPFSDSLLDEVHGLTLACLSGEADPEDVEHLSELLLSNEAVRRIYAHAIRDSFSLRRWAAVEKLHTSEIFNGGDSDTEFLRLAMSDADLIAGMPSSSISGGEPRDTDPDIAPPAPGFLGSAYHGTVGFFSQEVPLACLIATVIMGVMLLGLWAIKITPHQHIAEVPSQSVPSYVRPEMVFVGRITGMVDVKWLDDPRYLPPPDFAHVSLDRKYILSSGLLEITYDSGAKVILQGPCTYEVESTAGGYLSLGKLTARVGAGGGGRGMGKSGSNQKSEIRNQKSPSSFILHPSSLFSVRTPTAVVTDLGTEFGVEVGAEGASGVQVFQGLVTVAAKSGDSTGEPRKLGAGEVVRVEPDAKGVARIVDATGMASGEPARFVRRMPRVDPHAYFKAVLADNPVAYWRLGETGGNGTTVYDSADAAGSPQQGAQNGVFKKTDSFAGLGYPGPRPLTYCGLEYNNKSTRFWGDHYPPKKIAYIDAGNPPALQITGQLTLEAWVYIEEYGGDYHSGVISKYCGRRQPHGDIDQRSYNLLITRDGKPGLFLSPDGAIGDVTSVVSTTVVPLNTWVHLAAVYVPGESMEIYINGALDAELTTGVPASIYNSTGNCWIGMQSAAQWHFNFTGRIDEAAVYDTALSGARIAAHYAAAVKMAATETENRKED